MRTLTLPMILATSLMILGCGSTTGERTGSGALIAGAAGGAIGAASGNFGAGALIGAGVGAAGGYLYDQHEKGNID